MASPAMLPSPGQTTVAPSPAGKAGAPSPSGALNTPGKTQPAPLKYIRGQTSISPVSTFPGDYSSNRYQLPSRGTFTRNVCFCVFFDLCRTVLENV